MFSLTREQLLKQKVNVDIIEGVSDDNDKAENLLRKELDSHGFYGLELYQRIESMKGVSLVVLASQM